MTTDHPTRRSPQARELRTIRLALGLNQHQMASRLGCSNVVVCRYETGTSRVPKPLLYLARLIGQQDVTPPSFVPEDASVGMAVSPGTACAWATAGLGRCAGMYYTFQALT